MKCQEQKYVKLGRSGEWRPCTNEAKFDIVAYEGGSGFKRGETIRVCGVHKRQHEKRAEKDRLSATKEQLSDQAAAKAEELDRRAGGGVGPLWLDYPQARYSSNVVRISVEKLEELLKEAGR